MRRALWNEDHNKEEDVYDEASMQDLVDDDEMTPEEAGFMKGYTEA